MKRRVMRRLNKHTNMHTTAPPRHPLTHLLIHTHTYTMTGHINRERIDDVNNIPSLWYTYHAIYHCRSSRQNELRVSSITDDTEKQHTPHPVVEYKWGLTHHRLQMTSNINHHAATTNIINYITKITTNMNTAGAYDKITATMNAPT